MDGIYSYIYIYMIKYLNVNKRNISSNVTDVLKTKLKLLSYAAKEDESNANNIIFSFFHLIKQMLTFYSFSKVEFLRELFDELDYYLCWPSPIGLVANEL